MTQEDECRLQIKLRLEETDSLVQIVDHSKLAEIKAYRQKLRDYPSTSDFPNLEKIPDTWNTGAE